MVWCGRIVRIGLLLLSVGQLTLAVAAPPKQIDSAKLRARPLPEQRTDSLEEHVTERNQRLYDSIASKSQRRAIPRMLYRMLFRRNRTDTLKTGKLYDENQLLAPYAGKVIGEIRIERDKPFSGQGSWVGKMGNRFHTLTREQIIRRDLLFKSGQRFDPELIVRTQQLLLSRPYLSDAEIRYAIDPLDSGRVDLVIRTHDSWSIRLNAAAHSEKRTTIGVSEENIFGTGTRLKVETNFRRWNFAYGGNVVGYEMPNILGSFFALEVEAGRNFYEDILRLQLSKEFLKPTDYEVGASYTNLRTKEYFVDRDSSELIKARNLDLWGGWSHYFRPIRSSLYLTGHYHRAQFVERPEIGIDYNPALHDRDELLGGIGLYRERLYMTNMVYGFGRKEYLATGYRAELVSGYAWSAFHEMVYAGASLHMGGLAPFGYLVGGFTFGSYIDGYSGRWNRTALDLDLLWVSKLLEVRRSRIRQFVAFNYTQGWHRMQGYEELLRFTDENGLQAIDTYATGTNRMVVNTETVLFTPIQPWGFRFAFFGFLDAGTLGLSNNPLRNSGFATLGIGLRIRNERLVFGTLQLRLGVAFGRGGLVDCDYVSLSNTKHFEEYRFRPMRPEVVGFR